MKHANDSKLPWTFPDKDVLQTLFTYVKRACDHDQIMEVAQWIRVDAAKVATIMLSSVNINLMNLVRHAIRSYQGHPGHKFETYAKSAFVKKYGLTMYIPKDMADYTTSRILRSLAYKYPALRCKMRAVHKTVFTSDPPNHPPGKRSRVGDAIILLDGPDLLERVQQFPADFKFYLNDGFSITLQGGVRGDDSGVQLSAHFRQSVIMGSVAETAKAAAAGVNP